MSVLNVQKIVALVLAAMGIFLLIQGMGMSYYGRFGPGAGFLAVWVGGLLAVLSLALLAQSVWSRVDLGPFMAEGQSYRRPFLLGLACVVAVLALPVLGFRLSMLIFILVVPNIVGRQKFLPTLAVAVIGSFGVAYVFESLLRVRLPVPGFEVLRMLGL